MTDEILYMLGVVAVGFLVNYALRALPFLLFAGRDRTLPRWVERFGALISPVIIACLIVYSYTGLQWRTAWPYLAGALTVGLQLAFRNPLASIVAGTVLYMALLACGCTSEKLVLDAENPQVLVRNDGVYFAGRKVPPQEIPDILDGYDIPKTRTIHIRLDPEVRDLRFAKAVMTLLAHEGYRRPVLVTSRHAESEARPKAAAKPQTSPVRKVRLP